MSGSGTGAGFARACGAALLLSLLLVVLPLSPQALHAEDSTEDSFLIDVIDDGDGRLIDVRICPLPPPDTRVPAVASSLDELTAEAALSGVPVFDWCYGCSATAAAMLFGYYDRNGYPDMYTGPTNGGVCPLDNGTWGYGESPLSATHQGYDGLSGLGHVDDYWQSIGSTVDPYYEDWTEHDYADCTADFMGTSQYVNWSNTDGATTFFYYTDNTPIHDYSGSEGSTPPLRDGCHGMRLFAESRGYSVVQNYNQKIYGYDGTPAGFTFVQYTQEIDAGRPVLIQVDGHTMLGVGYDEPDTVYLHNTWDHNVHEMTWGGEYNTMAHLGVTVIELGPAASLPEVMTVATGGVEETTATGNGNITSTGGEDCDTRGVCWSTSPGPDINDSKSESPGSFGTGAFSVPMTGLSEGATYYVRAYAHNSSGYGYGNDVTFTTKPDGPTGLTATALGTTRIDLSWTVGAGADRTLVVRKAGSYPVDRSDGDQVYDDSGSAFTDSGLSPGAGYYYRAWSFEEGGARWSDGYAEANAMTDPVTVSVPDVAMAPDSTAPVEVSIAGAVDLASATISLDFNLLVAELTAVESGVLGEVSHNGVGDANATGHLTMSWSTGSGQTGDFLFATLTFHAVVEPPVESPLDLTVDAFSDSLGGPIPSTAEDGVLRVLGLMEGDVNLGLSTDIVDAMFIAQYTVGLRTLDAGQLLCGDTNDDGVVDIVDAMHIAQYTVDPDGSGGVLFMPLWQLPEDEGLLPPA